MEQSCRNYGYSEWQKTETGRRKMSSPGKCNAPEPVIPESFKDYQRRMPKRHNILAKGGKTCAVWIKAS